MIDQADMGDHLVEINGGNADRIRPDIWNKEKQGPHNKVRLIPYARNVPLWDGPDDEVAVALKKYIAEKQAASNEPFMFFGGDQHQERLARIFGHKSAGESRSISAPGGGRRD
jgi:hypothetical protein